jgi:Secretion system C-terminal sorting domain
MKQHYTKIPLFLLFFTFLIYHSNVKAQCSCSGGAAPLTVVYDTSGLIPPANDSTIYNFPQFNPSTGTLVCVNLEAWVTAIVRMRLENDEIYPIEYRIRYNRTDRITGTGLSTAMQNSLTKNYGPYPLTESDGNYFSGTDFKAIGPDTVLNNKLISTTISSNVAPFLGNGVVSYSYRVSGTTQVIGSTNYIFSINSIDRLRFRLTYQYCPNNLLAASIKEFAAVKKSADAVQLSWITENEEKTNSYDIEVSKDGRNYKSVITKSAVAANAAANYQHIYNLAATDGGKLFFRVKQKTVQGTRVSPVQILVLDEATQSFTVYPNPAHKHFNIEWSQPQTGPIQVEVVNSMGQQVFSKNYNLNGNTLMSVDLPNTIGPGLYYIKTKDPQTKIQQLTKLVIN